MSKQHNTAIRSSRLMRVRGVLGDGGLHRLGVVVLGAAAVRTLGGARGGRALALTRVPRARDRGRGRGGCRRAH